MKKTERKITVVLTQKGIRNINRLNERYGQMDKENRALDVVQSFPNILQENRLMKKEYHFLEDGVVRIFDDFQNNM